MENNKVMSMIAIIAAAMVACGTPASAAVSEPAAAVSSAKPAKTQTVTYKVSMHCPKCVKKVNENIAFEKGVKDLKVSLDDHTVTVTFDPSKTDADKIAAAITKLGYTVEQKKD